MPEITPSTIAAGTYRSLTEDYPTIGLYNFAVAHKDLSEDLVYQIVKTTFEHRVELMKAHPVAKETVPENIERNTLFLLLPWALRYYREKRSRSNKPTDKLWFSATPLALRQRP